jgi:cytochrome c oxidase subunit 2
VPRCVVPGALGATVPRALQPPTKLLRGRAGLLALALLLTVPLFGVLAGTAGASAITPESGGSPNADDIKELYDIVLVLAIVIFLGVEGALIYSTVKFKARKGAVPAQIRGNTRLEIGWTVGAALILVVLAVFTFLKLGDIRNPPASGPDGYKAADGVLVAAGPNERLPKGGGDLHVCVNGQQYIWRYTYARDCANAALDAPFSYTEMVVPTQTTVTLDIRSQDVAHSWWIPKLGGKFDAVPGYTNYTWFKIPAKFGGGSGTVFRGNCAELCGRGHANMIAQVRAVTPAAFERWLAGRKADIKAANDAAATQRKAVEAGRNP